jgi:hypothetical protein
MRYTEEELRDFLTQQLELWAEEEHHAYITEYPLEEAYARGAHEAYLFVLRFMEEYKLEEVSK